MLSGYSPEEEERLWEHQQEALLEKAIHFGENAKTMGYIEGPAGCGKTRMMLEDLEHIARQEQNKGAPNGEVFQSIIVVPTIDLVHQTCERIQQYFPHIEAGKYFGDEKDLSKPTTVTTYNSFMDLVESRTVDPTTIDMVVFDEAHRGLSDFRQEVTNQLKEHCLLIGYSATPDFNEEKGVGQLLGEKIWGTTVRELVENGRLAPVANVILTISLDSGEQRPSRGTCQTATSDIALDTYKNFKDTEENNQPILG